LAVRLFAAVQTLLAEEDFSRFLKKLNHWYPKARTGFNQETSMAILCQK